MTPRVMRQKNMSPTGLRTKNDCADETQQQLPGTKPVLVELNYSQSCETEKYGHESCGSQNQEWLLARANSNLPKPNLEQLHDPLESRDRKLWSLSPAGPGTKNDCAGKSKQLFTWPNPTNSNETIFFRNFFLNKTEYVILFWRL